jgi:uncharacterized membrane-anchored protein
MAMTAQEILSHPALERCVRGQAQTLLSIQETSPRIASVFATQQRWLMAHAALAQYFRNEATQAGSGLVAERFLDLAERHVRGEENAEFSLVEHRVQSRTRAVVVVDDENVGHGILQVQSHQSTQRRNRTATRSKSVADAIPYAI